MYIYIYMLPYLYKEIYTNIIIGQLFLFYIRCRTQAYQSVEKILHCFTFYTAKNIYPSFFLALIRNNVCAQFRITFIWFVMQHKGARQQCSSSHSIYSLLLDLNFKHNHSFMLHEFKCILCVVQISLTAIYSNHVMNRYLI